MFLQRAIPSLKPILDASQLPALVAAAAALAVYYFYVRWTERRAVHELSLSRVVREYGAGALLGVGMFAVSIGILWGVGCFRIAGLGSWQGLISSLLLTATHPIIEELLFRGIIFRITEESLGTWLAVLISSLLFGAIHFHNPNSGILPSVSVALAGIFFAAAYVTTRRLWFVIGAHSACNFVQGGIFGVAVSGLARNGLFRGEMSGPAILTGGAFGPEASVVVIGIVLLVGCVILLRALRKGKFVKAFWMRAQAI